MGGAAAGDCPRGSLLYLLASSTSPPTDEAVVECRRGSSGVRFMDRTGSSYPWLPTKRPLFKQLYWPSAFFPQCFGTAERLGSGLEDSSCRYHCAHRRRAFLARVGHEVAYRPRFRKGAARRLWRTGVLGDGYSVCLGTWTVLGRRPRHGHNLQSLDDSDKVRRRLCPDARRDQCHFERLRHQYRAVAVLAIVVNLT